MEVTTPLTNPTPKGCGWGTGFLTRTMAKIAIAGSCKQSDVAPDEPFSALDISEQHIG